MLNNNRLWIAASIVAVTALVFASGSFAAYQTVHSPTSGGQYYCPGYVGHFVTYSDKAHWGEIFVAIDRNGDWDEVGYDIFTDGTCDRLSWSTSIFCYNDGSYRSRVFGA